ncbi:TPA: LysR family transcriptional regulator [Burkholderia vietnamiensis]|uniref:LysR family transcriptional regulator n=1 Tax=Burkholderia vietnamiensis TaxID=60552 RepID=UPI001B910F7B|nr:LysR family transcriptional regulator [Burkholderia vietnamiensis]MBR8215538.1 LysR family transcriptional regulator [Burkholderia vietnamiensis]HDR9181122.1 LysR family transcriptional regulator [Burkholderia vietnamiensis]HDV8352419.1 LysR family transcriptional regulator [Burkholderia vietnamiensis]
MNRDLNDTLVFLRVVQSGSFTAAALALQIPKTTVSRRVRELEAYLGSRLLHRTTRKLRLTEAGSAYFEHCSGIGKQLDDAENAVQRIRSTPAGWLRVTLPYSFGITWVAPLIAGFCSRYPDVRLDILATHVPLDLFDDDVDVALRLGVLPDSSLVARRLGSFSTSVYASPAYVEQHGAPSVPDELRLHPSLALHQARSESGYTWPLRKAGRKWTHYSLKPVIVASDPALILDAARAGQGLLLAMDTNMAREVEAGRLLKVLPEWMGPPQDLNALFPRELVPSPKLQAFLNYLKMQLRFGDMQ